MKVAANIPPSTPVPMDCLAAAPAPVAVARGMTPRINAMEVITIGLRRSLAASKAASRTDLPSCISCEANSTIKIAFFCCQTHQYQQSDLEIDIVVESSEVSGNESSGEWNREQP